MFYLLHIHIIMDLYRNWHEIELRKQFKKWQLTWFIRDMWFYWWNVWDMVLVSSAVIPRDTFTFTIACHKTPFFLNWRSFSLVCRFKMPCKSFIWFKFRELVGHFILRSQYEPYSCWYSVVLCAACKGALFCINMMIS